jgi:hypothetical protein
VGVDLGASEVRAILFSHVSARAVEAVRLLMIDLLDLETLMKGISRRRGQPCPSQSERGRMNERGFQYQEAVGRKLSPRTRTMAITLRLPIWFRAKRRSGDNTSIVSFRKHEVR